MGWHHVGGFMVAHVSAELFATVLFGTFKERGIPYISLYSRSCFRREDGGDILLRNVGDVPDYTTLQLNLRALCHFSL